jgi:O-antigen/teichoic acid export membrane protein
MQSSIKNNIIWNAIGNVIYLMAQWIITILVTTLSGFKDAGILSLAMSISSTFQTIAMFGIRHFQVSDINYEYSDSTYFGARNITSLVAIFLCVVFSFVSKYNLVQLIATFLFLLFRIAESYSDVLHGIAQRKGRLDLAGKAFTIKGVGILVFFLLPFIFSKNLIIALACMTVFSFATTIFYDYIVIKRLTPFAVNDSFFRCFSLIKKVWPLCLYMLLFTATSAIPKISIENAYGDVALGAYASISAPAIILQTAAGYIYNPFIPTLSSYNISKEYKKMFFLLLKIIAVITLFAAVALLCSVYFGEFALALVFGDSIREYVYLLNPIIIASYVLSILALLCAVAVTVRSFICLISSILLGFVSCAILSPMLLKFFQLNGASYALIIGTLISIITLAISICFKTKKVEGQ